MDALAALLVLNPGRLDIVVASNLFGDILTDLGAAVIGSIGIAPSPAQALPLTAVLPEPEALPAGERDAARRALAYMGLEPGTALRDIAVDTVFIGSCTNGRSASTSNRNLEGRQGPGARTHLVSPAVAAATAVRGRLSAPTDLDG